MAAVETFGTTVSWDGDPIYGVTDITGPGMSREEIDITNHSSPAGQREKRTTVMDPGNISFSLYVDPADTGFGALQAAHDSNTTGALVVTAPDGTAISCSARVQTISYSFPVIGVLGADVTLTPTEAVTIDFGAGGS